MENRQNTTSKIAARNPFLIFWRILYPMGIHYGCAILASFIISNVIVAVFLLGYSGTQSISEVLNKSSLLATGIGNLIAVPFLTWCFQRDRKARGGKESIRRVPVSIYTAVVFCTASIGQLLNVIISISGLPDIFTEYGELQSQVLFDQPLWLEMIVIGVLAPIAEELVFRGLIFKRVQDYSNAGVGIVVSSLLFGIYHGNMIQFIYAAILGAFFAWLYWKTDSLFVVIAAHMAANIWTTIVGELAGYSWFLGIYESLLFSELIIAIIVSWYLRRKLRQ